MEPFVMDPSSTRFFVEEVGWFPAKSPPLILLAIIVLAMFRVALLWIPPPTKVGGIEFPKSVAAEFPEMVELVTFKVPRLNMMPPPLPR